MRKQLFLISFCFLFFLLYVGLVSYAQDGTYLSMPFSSLGWKESVRLEGGDPVYYLYIPDFTGVNWGQSVLYLNINASRMLRYSSSISVYGDGELLLNSALRPGENNFRVPLGAFSPNKDVHLLEIGAHLVISDDLCEDLASGNLFLVIGKDSFLNLYQEAVTLESLEDFLFFPGNKIEILLPPDEWSTDLQEAFIKLYAFLSRFYKGLSVQITAGVYEDEMKEPSDYRRIFLSEKQHRDFEIYGKSLYLTPRGVDAVLRVPELFVFTSSEVGKVNEQPSYPRQKVTLRDLGADGLSFRGIGEMQQTVYFTTSDLGGFPRSLKLVLYRNHLPCRFQASFSVKLNGEMIYSEKLKPEEKKELSPLTIQIPVALLGRENSLRFCFSYFPDVGHCQRSEAPFEGFISGDSYLEVGDLAPLPEVLTFGDVPTFFTGRAQVVLPDEASFSDLLIAAKLIAALRTLDRVPLLVEVLNYAQVTKQLDASLSLSALQKPFFRLFYLPWQIREYNGYLRLRGTSSPKRVALLFAFTCEDLLYILRDFLFLPFFPFLSDGHYSSDFLIFVDPPDTFLAGLASPVAINQGQIVLKSGSQIEPLLQVVPDQSLGILSVFREGIFPAIIFFSYGREDSAQSYFLKNFEGVETLRWLNGNVAVFGEKGLSRLLNVEIPPLKERIFSRREEISPRLRLRSF